MIKLLALTALVAGMELSSVRPRMLTPEENAAMSRVTPPFRPSASTAGTHCRRGEQVIYSCDFTRRRVSICRDGANLLYRAGPAGRAGLELGRQSPPVIEELRNQAASETKLRFANSNYSYGVYNLVAPEGVRWQSGVVVWRDGKQISEMVCRTSGRRQNFDGKDVGSGLRRESDPQYMGW